MKLRYLFLIMLLIPSLSNAQRWKRMRYEVVYAAGATNFLGELGGRNQVGSDYFNDLEVASTRYVLNIGMRYKLTQYISVKAGLSYARVAGDDKQTQEPYRNNRNLHFRSPIVELAAQMEFSWMREQTGSRYKIRRVRGRGKKGSQVYVYGFVGVAGFYMNPSAKYAGTWNSLQPLNTEGQDSDFFPGRKSYSRVQFAIPFGIGFKYALDKKSSIGLEYGLRKTFTDYIDDVSTTYVVSQWRSDSYGEYADLLGMTPTGAALSDPSLNQFPVGLGDANYPGACQTCPGQQRGDPTDFDSYMFLLITYNRKIRTTRRGLPKF
jgi:hypothetical protein